MRATILVVLLVGCGPPPSAAKCIAAHPDGNSQARLGLYDCGTGPCNGSCGSTIWGSGDGAVTDACASCVVAALKANTCTSRCAPNSDCSALITCLEPR